MLKRSSELIFISIFSIPLPACGTSGGDGGAENDDVVDDVAPVVSALCPTDGATDVEPTIISTATFKKDVFASTFDDSNISPYSLPLR